MGSDESHFYVSLIVRDSHKLVSANHNLFEENKGSEPKRNRHKALLPLGQTVSRITDPQIQYTVR